jgi:hypothetical protein
MKCKTNPHNCSFFQEVAIGGEEGITSTEAIDHQGLLVIDFDQKLCRCSEMSSNLMP